MNVRSIAKFLFGILLIVAYAMADDDLDGIQTSSYIESYSSENSILNLPGQSIGELQRGDNANTNISKEIIYKNDNLIDIKLNLEMPPKPTRLDLVLAMDTSGSMVQNYHSNTNSNETYLKWASNSIETILNKYPDARVSIVGWDDDDEKDDCNTSFMYIKGNETRIKGMLDNLSNECLETDHTIYSIGIKRAVQKLDAEPSKDPYNTSRIIIFVTGLSEFMAEPKNAPKNLTLTDQINDASRNRTYRNASFFGYQIYPIQIGIDRRFKWEYENISKISNGTHISDRLPNNNPISINNINDLSEEISKILENQRNRPMASNVEITDVLYPYLKLLNSESKIIMENRTEVKKEAEILSQDPPVLRWKIGTMNGEDNWTATIHTVLNLDLPIDVSEEKTPVDLSISNLAYTSKINFTWMTGYHGFIRIPEGRIDLFRNDSASPNTISGQKDSSAKVASASNANPRKQNGFEAIFVAIGLSMAGFIYRRRCS